MFDTELGQVGGPFFHENSAPTLAPVVRSGEIQSEIHVQCYMHVGKAAVPYLRPPCSRGYSHSVSRFSTAHESDRNQGQRSWNVRILFFLQSAVSFSVFLFFFVDNGSY